MRTLPVALGLSAMFVIAGCGSSGSSAPGPSTSPTQSANPEATDAASKAAAEAQIKTNWATFFKSGTPQSTAVGLLQDGSTLGAAIRIAAKIAKAAKTKESAVVSKVVFVDPTDANVTYSLLGNGKPLLPNADGKAVLQDGTWRVAKTTFCTLVGLGAAGKKVPGCAS